MIQLAQYSNPSSGITEAVEKLTQYYHVVNQDKISVYTKQANKSSFSWKTLGELRGFTEVEKFYNIKESCKWSTFLKAKFLLENFKSELGIEVIGKLTDEQVLFVTQTIRDGLKARKLLESWLKPMSDTEAQAIEDACFVDIGKTFKVLKLSSFEDSTESSFSVYPYILNIESAEEMAIFLRIQKSVRNCLIVTLQRNKEYQWKSTFFLFLVYKGTLYSVDNLENRLNLNNTEGCRNPDRYIERKYDKVWLPLELLDKAKKSNSHQLIVKGTKVYKIASLEDYAKKAPEIIYWLNVFVDRVIDFVLEQKVEQGVTASDLPKLLTYVNSNKLKIPNSGAGAYLEEIYTENCKSIVVQEKHLPKLVGTQEYVRNVLAYKRRGLIAESLQKAVDLDHKKNSEKVYDDIRKFVQNWPIKDLIKRSLQKKKYSYMQYPHFGFQQHPDGLQKESIFRMFDSKNNYSWNYENKANLINVNTHLYEYVIGQPHTNCACCAKWKWKQIIVLDFIDWRQFIEFFEITEKEIPIQMKQHLHQQLEMYVGNSILDDTDPIDELNDPWFRETENGMGGPLLRVSIPVCNRCLKREDK